MEAVAPTEATSETIFVRPPKNQYVSIAPRYAMLPLTQKVKPFHASVYESRPSGAPVTRVTKPGFPGSTRGRTVREWIPGVSTPEGVVVSTMTLFALAPDGADAFIRVAQHAAAGIVFTVTVGFPSVAMWLAQGGR